MAKKILLVYGKIPQNQRTDIEIIDLIKNPSPNIPDYLSVYCLSSAYIYANKKIAKNRLISIGSIDDIPVSGETNIPVTKTENKKSPEQDSSISAAKIDDVLISQSYNPSSAKLPVWMNQYHLECINNVFGKGCKIEFLDENERVIKVIEK